MTNQDHRWEAFPTRLFIGVIAVVCLALASSAGFTFNTLLRLRSQYLANRGNEIAAAVESQARGAGRRNNLVFWQTLLEQSYESYSGSVAFFALVDQSGALLAGAGDPRIPKEEFSLKGGSGLYVYELPLMPGRGPRSGMGSQVQGWILRVGLLDADADFIRRQALLNLAVSTMTGVLLLVLSLYLIRMLRRFLELRAREGAEQQLRAIGTMAASLAHEIRNPLGAMKGLTQLAQEELPPDHHSQQSLRTVVSEAERLERLVSDLLDFARTKDPQIAEFDAKEVLGEVRTMLQSKLAESELTLEVMIEAPRLPIRSDPGGFRQVLLNTLINAADATPKGGRIEVQASLDAASKSLLVRISDGGSGLGGRDPDDLFKPFVTTKTRGTGLGLAISRQIVERIGGSIALEDGVAGGAVCSIRIPAGKT